MRFSTLALDIDGTLTDARKRVPAFTCAEIRRVQRAGLALVFASSRMPRSIRAVMDEVGVEGAVVAYNGARVEHGGAVLHDDPLPRALGAAVAAEPPPPGVHVGLFVGDRWTVSALDYWALREARTSQVWPDAAGWDAVAAAAAGTPPHKVMVRGEAAGVDAVLARLAPFADAMTAYRPKGDLLELTSSRSEKADGVARALAALGAPADGVLAFGDNTNDVGMLRAAALGVAVANAAPALLAVADEVTLASDEDGVGFALRKHVPADGPLRA